MGLTRRFRIGMYGGGFDPPHNAHVALARAATAQLRLDRLFVVPTGDAYHKDRSLSAGAQRLALCRLAFSDVPGVVVSDVELTRSGSSYTFDTLSVLRRTEPEADWFLLMGADQARLFCQWHRWAEILQQATPVIAVRPETDGGDPAWRADDPLPGTGTPAAAVRLLDFPAMDCSASCIRAHAASGRSIAPWVPASVARYIEVHHLYQSEI